MRRLTTFWRIAAVMAIEAAYMVASRLIVGHFKDPYSLEAEAFRTPLRLLAAGGYWFLMKELILSGQPRYSAMKSAPLVLALVLFLAIPVAIGNYPLPPSAAVFVAVAALPVGLKEEFLFRGILQNLLVRKFGGWPAVLLTSVLFTGFHVGVVPETPWSFAEPFLASSIIGLVYVGTGSIFLVVWLHTIYDAVFSFSPFYAQPLHENWGFAFALPAALLTSLWLVRLRRVQCAG
jgi:membrane protease YdiL (CAAX protease family)